MSHEIKIIYSKNPPKVFSHDESGTNSLTLDIMATIAKMYSF